MLAPVHTLHPHQGNGHEKEQEGWEMANADRRRVGTMSGQGRIDFRAPGCGEGEWSGVEWPFRTK